MMDARRRQWVPLSVDVARSRTGRNLQGQFGPMGLLIWILVLAAAKKSINQGEFEYVTESEGWRRLGLDKPILEFTLGEFFTYTGRIHATRVKRPETKGQRQGNDGATIQIRAWNDWATTVQRRIDADKKSRKRAQKTRDVSTTLQGTDLDLDSEREREEVEKRKKAGLEIANAFLAKVKRVPELRAP